MPSRGSARVEFLRQHIAPWSNIPDPSGASLRRCRAGLGYVEKNSPISLRTLRPDTLDSEPHASEHVMALIWNGGNLERQSRLDALNDFIAGNFHIGLLQESAGTRLPNVLQSRAIAVNYLPDGEGGNLAVTAGGSGLKSVFPIHADFDGAVPRPWTETNKAAMYMHCCSIAWVNSEGKPVQRAGLDIWQVATIHYNHTYAKKPDSVRHVLTSVFQLMFRDKVRLLGGDFNQAAKHVPEVLESLTSQSCPNVSYQILSAQSPEVVAILFNYEGHPVLQAEQRTAIDKAGTEDFGLRNTDTDAHFPLILCIKQAEGSTSSSAQPRSWWHSRSEQATQKRKERKRQKAAEKRKRSRQLSLGSADVAGEEAFSVDDEVSE